MNDDNFVTLFGSPAGSGSEVDELDSARTHGYLKLSDGKPMSTDQSKSEDEQQQALLQALIAIL